MTVFCSLGQWEVTVWRNAGPQCPSTSPPGPWRLIGQWEKRGAPKAPPVLLDGQFPPWWFYGCRGCCCVCHGPHWQNKWAVMGNLSTAPFRLCHHHHPPLPLLPCWQQVLHSSTQGRADSSWTGCCQRRDRSTDVRSIPSSGNASSMGSQPDTRSTGQHMCELHILKYANCSSHVKSQYCMKIRCMNHTMVKMSANT